VLIGVPFVPVQSGLVLIRGSQLDGPHAVGFSLGDGSSAYTDLQFPPGKETGFPGWRNWPSATRLQASGCYAYQVDGTTFSEVIVFRGLAVSR
jgi:hypothetical protein